MEQASNGFSEGLIMDLDPMSTPNNCVTSALNATLVTYNGNEYILQNDMGNGRVETAFLPEGFVPVGTCSFGGIIYVASYNPLTGVSQLGSFPSPERNFGFETDTEGKEAIITNEVCINHNTNQYIKEINIPICDVDLTPGDKFIITVSKDAIESMFGYVGNITKDGEQTTEIPCVDIFVGIQQDSKVIELQTLQQYETNVNDSNYGSLFINNDIKVSDGEIDLDSYRTVISSPYQVVSGSFSGKLCLIVKLKILDSFEVKYSSKLFVDE